MLNYLHIRKDKTMKLLFIIVFSIIPINFANGMLTITSTDQTGPQFTLTIDTATAPEDMLEVFKVAKNPILKDFEKRVERTNADRVSLGKS